MHAAIHQLLSLRDGAPVDAQIAHHVERCAECAAELARLVRVQQRLQSLPAIEPPAAAWQRIAGRMHSPQVRRRSRAPWAIAAAIVVAVAGAFLVSEVRAPGGQLPAVQLRTPSAPEKSAAIALEQLVAQSQELDQMLQYLPERPSVERVTLAATIDTIEARVQWLDQQLSYDTDLDDVRATQLWRERVDLMDSLVKVRYAEGAPMSF